MGFMALANALAMALCAGALRWRLLLLIPGLFIFVLGCIINGIELQLAPADTGFHRQGNALAADIDLKHFNTDEITGFDRSAGGL